LAGGIDHETLPNNMANTLSQSNFLHNTYAPVQLLRVGEADAAGKRDRAKLREPKQDESRPALAKESPARKS
jgi:hypothetical protein